nr:recombinase family protein [Phycicoccus sp. Root563]
MRNEGTRQAVIYCRQSQDTEKTGAAVERQEEACRALALARGWDVVEVVRDNAVSASKGKTRPGWERVLELVEAGRADVIVAWHMDRITRTTLDLERLITLVERSGAAIATATGDLDLTTDQGRMVARILAAVARGEVERKAARQSFAERKRAESGKARWSRRPFGYEKGGVLREVEAERLRWAYRQILGGARVSTIVRAFNEDEVKTATGSAWTTQAMGKLLRDPRNAGLLRYQGEVLGAGSWEPILPEDQWRVAVARMERPEFKSGGARGTSGAWLVKVATCAECEGRVFTVKRSGSEVRNYTCQRGCIFLPQEWVEGRVYLALAEILHNPENARHWRLQAEHDSEDSAALRAELAVLDERQRTLADDYATGLLTRAQMLSGTDRVRARMTEVGEELDQLGAGAGLDRLNLDPEYVAQELEAMQPDEVRELLRAVTQRVVLHRRGKGSRAGLRPELVEVVAR